MKNITEHLSKEQVEQRKLEMKNMTEKESAYRFKINTISDRAILLTLCLAMIITHYVSSEYHSIVLSCTSVVICINLWICNDKQQRFSEKFFRKLNLEISD